MRELVFATNNAHKLCEARAILGNDFKIVSLSELSCFEDIAETADTLQGNALLKARFVAAKYGVDCFSDDTGLEIDALDGAPGVFSARFAGEDKNSLANVQKVLHLLEEKENRAAQFSTVIALIFNGKESVFEGKIRGKISTEPRGITGFGYDPIFIPDGYTQSFAQLTENQKNAISHRALALQKLAEFLKTQPNY
ncbi:MAG: non-canonical purine NTP diphosphatase [Paludibacter sp.]|nr:non-canonical purine NTP diphosphatase [Paludibacter sp.]